MILRYPNIHIATAVFSLDNTRLTLEIVAWRVPFGDSGILSFFLQLNAEDTLKPALQIHTLRIIGNSCADTDENRARVVEGNHLGPIILRLKDEALTPFAVPVLYNIMVDYGQLDLPFPLSSHTDLVQEPAQLKASQENLNQSLTALLSSPNIFNHAPFVSYICKILILLSTQECEAGLANPLTTQLLLNLTQDPTFASDPEDFTLLATASLGYLASDIFQKNMITGADLPLFLNTVH